MSGRIRGRLVCEDRRQESFFRKLLEPIFGTRLDVKISPNGQGAASAWVLKQYPTHVREWVRRRPDERKALVTVIDGDNVGTVARQAEAATSLRVAGEPVIGPQEPIAICVPTWSIETWLLFLNGDQEIDESQSHKQRFQRLATVDVAELARRLAATRVSALPSMQAGIVELDRVRP